MEIEQLITYKVERFEMGDKYKIIYTHGNVDKTYLTTEIKIYDKDVYDRWVERNTRMNKLRRKEIKYEQSAVEKENIIDEELIDEYDKKQDEINQLNKDFEVEYAVKLKKEKKKKN